MDGAAESGIRAALEVLNNIKPQSLSSLELKVNFNIVNLSFLSHKSI